nr:hypothetical membrane protein, CobN/magnesium chelatase family [uncultured archaeon]
MGKNRRNRGITTILLVVALFVLAAPVYAQPENMTVFAKTTSDENGNYTFSNLTAGNYTIEVAYYTPAMGGKWFTGSTNASVDDGGAKTVVDVWLSFGEAVDALEIENATADSSCPSGTSTISGQTLAHGMGGATKTMTNATVLLMKMNESEDPPSQPENMTVLAKTTSDEKGNYTFSNLTAGDYTIEVAYYTPAMGGTWFTGSTNASIGDGADLTGTDVWLSLGEAADALEIENATVDSSCPSGSSTISGQTLAHGMGGATKTMTNATVLLMKMNESGDYGSDDDDDPPLAEALVLPAPNTTTGADGAFTFTNLPEGKYTITALSGDAIGNISIEIDQGACVSNFEIWLNEIADNETASATRNATYNNSGGSYGTGSISGRVYNIPTGDSALVTITSYTGDGNLGSVNREPKMVFFLQSPGDVLLARRTADRICLNVSVYDNHMLPPDLNLTTYGLIFASHLTTKMIQDVLVPLIAAANESGATVICTYPEHLTNINLTEHPNIMEYWESRNDKNMERLLVYLGVEFCGLYGLIEEPIITPGDGIYHPDADPDTGRVFENLTEYLQWYGNDTGTHHVYNPDNPTIGLVFWKQRAGTGEIGVVDALIRDAEARGANVIPAFQPFLLFEENLTMMFMDGNESAVDVMIDLGLGMGPLTVMVKKREYLELMNVPVMKCIELYTTIEEWENETTGKDGYFNMQIPVMEIAGEIEFIVVGGRVYNATYGVEIIEPIDYQIGWAIDRALSWGSLRQIENSEKKVAILYYHHSVGNGSALAAANLDVAPSIVNILHAMNDSERGYTLGGAIPTDRELLDLVLSQGRNIGVWVPDQIKNVAENYDVALVSEEEYLTWFETKLPEKKQNEVTERWGEPPGRIMVYENETGKYLVIPKITLGNILIAPQPSRAGEQNMTALYHDQSVPPTHQYIAFYYWLNHVYEADAIVSMGRHGTQEWLPGKGVGLSARDCWPAILIQDMPVVYPYEVEGIGEGIVAKRRGSAVMIDHLTPVIVAAGLYGNLSNLEQTIPLYEQEENGTLKGKYREQIIDMCSDLNLDYDLGVNLTEIAASNDTAFEEFLEEVHDYLLEIKRTYMPYGLHIMGRVLSDDSLVDMTRSILGYDFREYIKTANITENQTRLLISEVILNGATPRAAQESVLGWSENETGPGSGNKAVAMALSDENGNYTFSTLAAGNYTIDVAYYTPAMGGTWFIGSNYTNINDGEHLGGLDVWLTFGSEAEAQEIVNATVDLGGASGTSTISGRTLAYGMGGTVMTMDNSTVVLRKETSGEGVAEMPLTDFLNLAIEYADNLRDCEIEIPRTLDALEGKYILPGPSNDPIRNPAVLPTGRNFYGFDPNIVPTEAAWKVGCELIDQLLSQYYNGTDESYPKKIGFVMFSANTMRDLGVLESEIFYLLGVEPVWDNSNNIHDVKIIPSEELGRPRIDAVVTMTGIYRENWPRQIELINRAVRLASEADDSPHHRNFVNESTQRTYNWLIDHNYTEEQAHELSLIRVFGPPEGVWGVGGLTAAIAGTGTWDSEETIADLYIRNMANVYGDTIWGEQYVDLFKQNLDGIDVAIFSWTSHSHSVLGIDHTFEFFGGLSMAVRHITGESPDMWVNNLKNPGGAKLETLQHVLMRDLRSMYYNELWIKGMMEHGYAGAGAMSEGMSNLWGWMVTNPDLVTDEIFDTMHSIYIQDMYDMGLKDWFNENNAWARQEMMARMIEATRMQDSEGNPYWTPSDVSILKSLAQEYQQSVEKFGPCCCIVCCGNVLLDTYMQGIISALQPSEEEQRKRYQGSGDGSDYTYPYEMLSAAQPSEEEQQEQSRKNLSAEGVTNQTTSTGVGTVGEAIVELPEETGETAENIKKGRVMKEEEPAAALAASGAPLMGLIAVLAILVFVGLGFWIKARKQ